MRIACIGSGPASMLFALAVNRCSKTSAVTLFRREPFDGNHTPGFALSRNPRRNLQARLEAVLDAPLPFRRWRQADVIRRDARTTIAGELGAGAEQAHLLSMLATSA